ncbi:TlpA disulfide reductase family protein [Flavobacterium sp. I3-2]|uniref:TlpA disulfide reductase family protein n=1 Tax=Flavobacterium sp. I3-2 TaxID=2748319 RepID=UPI0015AE60E3|nr:TlpA disulfide reductase family protein [Flavobacterium sp. I3-2]
MKKIFTLACAVAVLAACNKSADSYTINGTVQGFEDGTKVYILEEGEQDFIKLDSAEIKGGLFEFKGAATETDLKFIELGSTKEFIVPFILENGEIKVTYDKAKPEDSKVVGSKNNDYLATYNTEAFKLQKQARDFQQANNDKMMQAQQAQDMATIESLRAEYNAIGENIKKQNIEFLKTNKDAFISLLLLEQLTASQAITNEEFKTFYDALDASLKTTKRGKELADKLANMEKVAIGKMAPDFSAPNTEGKMVSLKESLGKVTIIDFWAAWCGPCRQENPNVVALYNKYKDQGLAIIGVSLDKDAEAWKKAIADDNLTWTQVSNLKYWEDPIAKEYNVQSIPAMFVLDASGKIVAKDLRGPELDAKIAELLK